MKLAKICCSIGMLVITLYSGDRRMHAIKTIGLPYRCFVSSNIIGFVLAFF
jgi:hypothetical protein